MTEVGKGIFSFSHLGGGGSVENTNTGVAHHWLSIVRFLEMIPNREG